MCVYIEVFDVVCVCLCCVVVMCVMCLGLCCCAMMYLFVLGDCLCLISLLRCSLCVCGVFDVVFVVVDACV